MNILVTADDGYSAPGTRVLVHCLNNEGHNVKIAAIKGQMSSVGGAASLAAESIGWGKEVVDGVEAIWVEGTPVDAVELAKYHFSQVLFDCVVSGINMGPNLGGGLNTSGTFSAVFRAINLGLALRALAISWDCPLEYWHNRSDGVEDWRELISWPGQAAIDIFNFAMESDFWGSLLLNINFPKEPTVEKFFTIPAPRISDCYDYSLDVGPDKFSYVLRGVARNQQMRLFDTGAINNGFISITPCQATFGDGAAICEFLDH